MKSGARGITRLLAATRYSLQGIGSAWRNEAAFRQEVGLLAVGLPCALLLARNVVEFLLLMLPLLLILLAELANSAIESIVDRLTTDHDELSGRAKDMGSAVVFMALCIAGLSWTAILAARIAASW